MTDTPHNTPKHPEIRPSSAQARVLARYAAAPWPSYNECARLEGVPLNTAKNWRKKSDAFRLLLEERRAEAIAEHIAALDAAVLQLGPRAVEVIRESFEDPDPKTQTQNARWAVDHLLGKARERVEMAGADGGPVPFTIIIDRAHTGGTES